MTTLEKLNRRAIELIHGLPLKEALKIEQEDQPHPWYTHHPLTLGRIMQALGKDYCITGDGYILEFINENSWRYMCKWKLTKPNNQEADTSDQTPETQEALLSLMK